MNQVTAVTGLVDLRAFDPKNKEAVADWDAVEMQGGLVPVNKVPEFEDANEWKVEIVEVIE